MRRERESRIHVLLCRILTHWGFYWAGGLSAVRLRDCHRISGIQPTGTMALSCRRASVYQVFRFAFGNATFVAFLARLVALTEIVRRTRVLWCVLCGVWCVICDIWCVICDI